MTPKSCTQCFQDLDPRARKCPHCRSRQPGSVLHRDVDKRLVAGVCAAAAEELGVDRTLVRALFLVALVMSGGIAFWLYVALWVLTPAMPGATPPLERWVEAIRRFFAPRSTALERVAPASTDAGRAV